MKMEVQLGYGGELCVLEISGGKLKVKGKVKNWNYELNLHALREVTLGYGKYTAWVSIKPFFRRRIYFSKRSAKNVAERGKAFILWEILRTEIDKNS